MMGSSNGTHSMEYVDEKYILIAKYNEITTALEEI